MRLSPLEPWFRQFPLAPIDDSAVLIFEDLSWRSRFGCKGPGAETWLANAGYRVPPEPNSAAIDADGVLVARLATAEFLIEAADGAAGRVESTLRRLTPPARPSDVYPVARQDLVIGIEGAAINALLRQRGPLILTSMIGVSVVSFLRRAARGPVMTLWVDPSFAHYFWTTVLEVGGDLGRPISIVESSMTRPALE
jgi:hypothetical protein